MPEPRSDPFAALRLPITPLAPDPAFAADLRDRVVRAVLALSPKEPSMTTDITSRPRNGYHHGDVSYITLGLPDLDRGRAFYGAVLGWRFSPGNTGQGAQVDDVVPMVGLSGGTAPGGSSAHGTVLGFRVDDISRAVASVRAYGGTISEPQRQPYGLAAEGYDDQGVPFSVHELAPLPSDRNAGDVEFHNGAGEGDISYLTMVVPDLDAARAFYGGVFNWTFNIGRAGGAQVTGVAPQIGMTTQPEAGPVAPGVILCYRVDDLTAAIERVRAAGGQARPVAQRPYGLESLCADDQGTPFYLHQF